MESEKQKTQKKKKSIISCKTNPLSLFCHYRRERHVGSCKNHNHYVDGRRSWSSFYRDAGDLISVLIVRFDGSDVLIARNFGLVLEVPEAIVGLWWWCGQPAL